MQPCAEHAPWHQPHCCSEWARRGKRCNINYDDIEPGSSSPEARGTAIPGLTPRSILSSRSALMPKRHARILEHDVQRKQVSCYRQRRIGGCSLLPRSPRTTGRGWGCHRNAAACAEAKASFPSMLTVETKRTQPNGGRSSPWGAVFSEMESRGASRALVQRIRAAAPRACLEICFACAECRPAGRQAGVERLEASLCASPAATLWQATLNTGVSPARPQGEQIVKVFILVDMEGISGICLEAHTTGGTTEYEMARRWMTQDVNAAVQGALDGGATEVVVADGHGTNGMYNLVYRSARGASYIRQPARLVSRSSTAVRLHADGGNARCPALRVLFGHLVGRAMAQARLNGAKPARSASYFYTRAASASRSRSSAAISPRSPKPAVPGRVAHHGLRQKGCRGMRLSSCRPRHRAN